ncbi:MAG: radical SAM protein [Candidatus Helarchaeota archaeon]
MSPYPLILDDGFFKPCNLNCQYCRKTPSIKKQNGYYDEIRGLNWTIKKMEEYKKISKWIQNVTSFGAYKISGHGEITLINKYFEFFAENKLNILITNGTGLNKEKIRNLQNYRVVVQLSLDGHTREMNQARGIHPKQIISLISALLKLEIPIEINTVITKFNITKINTFFKFLQSFESDLLICMPFPVRNFSTHSNETLKPSESQIERFFNSLENLSYNYSVPPKKFIDSLKLSLKTDRIIPCFLPRMIVSWNYNYDILACPCGFTDSYFNLEQFYKTYVNEENLRIPLEDNPLPLKVDTSQLGPCKNCFTHYDIINLFILDELNKKEIQKIPTFRNKDVLKNLLEWKRFIVRRCN